MTSGTLLLYLQWKWGVEVPSFIILYEHTKSMSNDIGKSTPNTRTKPSQGFPFLCDIQNCSKWHKKKYYSSKKMRFDIVHSHNVKKRWEKSQVPQSQTAALPRHQEEEETDKNPNKHNSNKHTKSTKISSLSSPSEAIAMLKRLKNRRTNWHKVRHKNNRLVE